MNRKSRVSCLLVGTILLTLSPGGPLHAQADESVEQSRDATVLEEVIVTARRREESLQEVAASIAVMSESMLEKQNIAEFLDYATYVPGISMGFDEGPTGFRGKRRVGIRGVQRFSGLTASTVGFYIDETPVDFPNARIYDMERIEVLRGPQGTLYGAGSVGGAIRILTNQPDPSGFAASIDGTWSDTDDGDSSAYLRTMLNLPLIDDTLALRMVALYQDEGGYIDALEMTTGFTPIVGGDGGTFTGETVQRDANSQEVTGFRAALGWQVTENLTITPSVFYQKHKLDSSVNFIEDAGFSSPSKVGLVQTSSQEDFLLASLNVTWHARHGSLVSTTSVVNIDNDSIEDSTDGAAAAFGGVVILPNMALYASQKQNSVTHETRFVSDLKGKYQFTAGLFLEKSERPLAQLLDQTEFEMFGLPSLALDYSGERNLDQYALFGEASYFALEERLELTLGLRAFRFETEIDDLYGGWLFAGTPPTMGKDTETGVNPKFVASYALSDDHRIYASVADGFRPGGANIALPDTCQLPGGMEPPVDYDSDELTSYETGLKSSFLDSRVTLNVAAYISKWDNLQVSIPLSGCNVSGIITNSGTAESVGGELEIAARLFDGLDITFGAAYIDAELSEDNALIGASKGDKLLDIPEWTYSGSAQYTFPLGETGLQAYGRFYFNHRDSAPRDFTGTIETDAYTETNLRFGVFSRTGWEVALFVENLSDTRPNLSGAPNLVLPGVDAVTLRPRTFGINARKSF